MKITANMVTIARIVLMPIPGYLLYQDVSYLFVTLAVIAVLGATDYLDGIMARKEGPTVLGGLLDPIADKIFIAVIFLPLTERDVPEWGRAIVPLWMVICMFSRDFLVTALRTSTAIRKAPIRTTTVAKFKTAIQMTGIGYVLFFYTVFATTPDSPWMTWPVLMAPILIPFSLIVYRLIKGQKQGLRSTVMITLTSMAVIIRYFLGPNWTGYIILFSITALTLYSGVSYMVDAMKAFKKEPPTMAEGSRFLLEGVLVPTSLMLLTGRFDIWVSALIITAITLEFANGGLANLLGSAGVKQQHGWLAAKAVAQLLMAGSALAIVELELPVPQVAVVGLICACVGLSVLGTVLGFAKHKTLYLSKL